MGVVVDSSVLIAIERSAPPRGAADLLERLLPGDSWVSAVTTMELRIGALLGETEDRRAGRMSCLADVTARCPVLAFAEREAEEAAALFVALRRSGHRIGERDLLIAATAIANGHSLITLNRAEFERVPGLSMLDAPDFGAR
ncbi:MAG: VapC toxin family PIN domain ribonuclease [Anaerolinea sp.]|nr:VapC toxin family PIN domain ribonuclease [Anaerolinea sp.]